MQNRHLFLREPKLSDKEEYLAFLAEWGTEDEITPFSARLNGVSYEMFIENLPWKEKGLFDKANLVPDNTYILVDEKNHIYGALNLRHSLNFYLLQYGGHIGYGIRPSERHQGYGKLILKLGLEIAKKKKFEQILITCDEDNESSKKIILSQGGILENKVFKHDGYILRYWIHLNRLYVPRRFLIIFTGHLASLKSVISKRFARDLKVNCFNKDDIKEIIATNLGYRLVEENTQLSLLTFKLMKQYFIDSINVREHVILESNFSDSEYKELVELADEMNVKVVTIFMTGTPKILHERYVKRERDRHPSNQSIDLLNFVKFAEQYVKTTIDSTRSPHEVDTDSFEDKDYDELKKHIIKWTDL